VAGTKNALLLTSAISISNRAMIDRIESDLGNLHSALNLRAYRQEVLASNIANADTPNYKARDFDFKTALNNATSGKGTGAIDMTVTSSRHIAGSSGATSSSDLQYRTEYQGSVDGNTVNLDVERSAFTENALQYETTLTVIRGKFSSLSAALQSQGS